LWCRRSIEAGPGDRKRMHDDRRKKEEGGGQ
jgi:hypothetical protein